MIPNILTGGTVIFTGRDGAPVTVSKTHKSYAEILRLIQTGDTSEESYDALYELIYPVNRLRKIAESDGTNFTLDDFNVLSCSVNGQKFILPTTLSATILRLYEQKGDLTPFIRFVEKLTKNPDPEVIVQLWDFIQACGLCLDTNGNFLAYKIVRQDFKSIYDGETDNTPGTVVKMKRKHVEKNQDKTCSSGLHFAAWEYLSHYSSSGKIVLVSVSPRDVVSIPSDYQFQKGRACRYKIVREIAFSKELQDVALYEADDSDYCDDSDYFEE